ncbi:MAG: alpha/beta fold hydrolase [Rhizobiaceae bacterium]|nr:alpha/beta fold hydrolase [Rhizobiaceae bacterium]MCV0404916.1 alpha/beta fold hydrolase [Rhizobiaceae bacterium]
MSFQPDFVRIETAAEIHLQVAMAGEGPLVVLVHGFPESWYSWRVQLADLARAGFRAAALSIRGYDGSSRPYAIEAYSIVELADDIAAVINALDPRGAVLVGHDWGAVQVQAAALLHAPKVLGLVSISVPAALHPSEKPSSLWARSYRDRLFYQSYFQQEGVAEAEFEADPERFVRVFFRSLSGQGSLDDNVLFRPLDAPGLLDGLPDPADLPTWLSREDVEFYADSFRRSGLRGPLNRYRCVDLDWELMNPVAGRMIEQPAIFIGGLSEPTRYMMPGRDRYDDPVPRMRDVRGVRLLEGVGHWVQQEAPARTSHLLLDFLHGIGLGGSPATADDVVGEATR